MIRKEPRHDSNQGAVLTDSGLLPSSTSTPQTSDVSEAQSAFSGAPQSQGDDVITQLFRGTRYLLTLKGRTPFRLAGLETYERLDNVASFSLELLAKRYDPRLAQLYQGLQSALSPFTHTSRDLQQGAAWLHDIA